MVQVNLKKSCAGIMARFRDIKSTFVRYEKKGCENAKNDICSKSQLKQRFVLGSQRGSTEAKMLPLGLQFSLSRK